LAVAVPCAAKPGPATARLFRHHHIREDRPDLGPVLAKRPCLDPSAASPTCNVFSSARRDHAAHAGFIIHHQDNSPPARGGNISHLGRAAAFASARPGDKAQSGAFAGLAVHRTKPPWPRAMPSTVARPRPVPCDFLVVKNGRKCGQGVPRNPMPVSPRSRKCKDRFGTGIMGQPRRGSGFSAARVSVPPLGMASRA